MKLKLRVAMIQSFSGKPADASKPNRVTWEVRLDTEPHVGDFALTNGLSKISNLALSNDALPSAEAAAFEAWAAKLKVNQILEVEFGEPK